MNPIDRIDRRLKAADPLRLDLTVLPEEAATALVKEIVMQPTDPPPANKRKRFRVAVVAGAAALLIGAPAAALGVYQGIHTGFFGSGGESEPGEEFLNSDAPEIKAVVKELSTEFPLPPGADYDRLLARYPSQERFLVQRTALGQEVSFYAACAWYRFWLNGDAAQRAQAQSTVDAVASWKYWRSDDGQAPFQQIAAETRAGTDTTVRQFITANC
jgi:hypothetical protein